MSASTVGKRIKRLREKKRITQTDLAEHLGISQSTFVRYEQNKIKRFKENIFEKMAEILDTTTEYLLGDEFVPDIRHLPKYLQEFVADPENHQYIAEAYIQSLSQKVRMDVARSDFNEDRQMGVEVSD